jgi:S-adenosylmethionine decarboxylase
MNVGTEWLVDAEGCSAEALRDIETLRRVCDTVIRDLALQVVGEPQWHQFPQPGGVTGLYLLTESHLACHTYPETRTATFNLYCCKARPDWQWEERLTESLGAARVRVRQAARGNEAGDQSFIEQSISDQATVDHDSFEAKVSEVTSAREVSSR